MKFLTATLPVILTATVFTYLNAQTHTPDTAVFAKIRQAELTTSQVPYLAHYLTDVAGPRLTNSEGYRRAANWAVNTMKQWGLSNVAIEPWGEFGKQWDIERFSITMTAPYTTPLRAYPTPWSPNTMGQQKGRVVVLTGKQYQDTAYLAKHLAEFKGKMILVTPAKPLKADIFKPQATRMADTTLASLGDNYMVTREEVEDEIAIINQLAKLDLELKKAGALALIASNSKNADGTVFVNGYYGYKLTDPETLPQVTISIEDAQRIKRLCESGQTVEIALDLKAKFSTANTQGYNVVGEIPGSDPALASQLVMLGGHLDSWSAGTGATDNAAGCIVMLEAVRLLDSLGLKPKRTIRIALWDGEEQGLLGSYNYVKKHFINGSTFALKPDQSKVSAYFNLDNGSGKIRGIYAQHNTAAIPIFEAWLRPLHDLDATTVSMSNTGSTDHLSFDWAGIPGFQFIQDELDYETRTHHSELDDYDHLQIDDLKQAAIVVASFIYQAAVQPDMIPRKELKKEKFVFDGF